MMHIPKPISFIVFMMIALNASAAMTECIDSSGQVSFTNLGCPSGIESINVGSNIIVNDENPMFSQQELDQMLAPIALYVDPLLSQILMAATYPLEVVEAARWVNSNPDLTVDNAAQSVADKNWDPSIKSLIHFPQILQTLDQNIEWTERLGDAFLSQQTQVMDTIQNLRQKALSAGNLNSNAQVNVSKSDGIIELAAVDPEVVYVPYYDPAVIYGIWWWPNTPPIFWTPWIGYGRNPGFAWGKGVHVGTNYFYGTWGWRTHCLYDHLTQDLVDGHTWQHDPKHRHGVPYRNTSLSRQFGHIPTAPAAHSEFRGYAPSVIMPPKESENRVQTEPLLKSVSTVTPIKHKPHVEPHAHALENIGKGHDARHFSARGNASLTPKLSRPAKSSPPEVQSKH